MGTGLMVVSGADGSGMGSDSRGVPSTVRKGLQDCGDGCKIV